MDNSRFPHISHIDDIRPFVAHKREISFIPGPDGSTVVCYQFQDSGTFDSPQAAECRGIVFDRNGKIAARPLHKFFNLGEQAGPQQDPATAVRVMDKLDGSMIHTVWLDGEMFLKSKKSFNNKQVAMANEWLLRPENRGALDLCRGLAYQDVTLIFELTSPANRIVVGYDATELRLLHARRNESGSYFPRAAIENMARTYGLRLAGSGLDATDALASLPTMEGAEGFVLQFENGDMVKAKCPWYLQLHRTVSFTRERDIAEAAVEERLDDIKAALAEMGHNIAAVEAIESRVMQCMLETKAYIEGVIAVAEAAGTGRKDFAIANKGAPAFGMLMAAFNGATPDYRDWFKKHVLKQQYSLDPVAGMPASSAVDD